MGDVTKFPGFNGRPGVLAIPAQMTDRIQEAKRHGREVHVVACIAERTPTGGWTFSPYWDKIPRELMSYMASELHLLAHDDDPPEPDRGIG